MTLLVCVKSICLTHAPSFSLPPLTRFRLVDLYHRCPLSVIFDRCSWTIYSSSLRDKAPGTLDELHSRLTQLSSYLIGSWPPSLFFFYLQEGFHASYLMLSDFD